MCTPDFAVSLFSFFFFGLLINKRRGVYSLGLTCSTKIAGEGGECQLERDAWKGKELLNKTIEKLG